MLQAIHTIRGIGQFASVAGNPAVRFARLTLIYGENGCGKTTLSAILRSLGTGDATAIRERTRLGATAAPEVAFACTDAADTVRFQANAWSRTIPDVVVFDDLFVEENVYSGLQITSEQRQHLHELIIGSRGVALARDFTESTEHIAALSKELLLKARAIPEAVRAPFSLDNFCTLPRREHLAQDIAAAERRVEALSRIDAVQTTPPFPSLALPDLDLPAVDALLARGLPELDTQAVAHVKAHFARLGEQGERWVAAGMEKLGTESDTSTPQCCPFCARDLRDVGMVTHYRAYFSNAYALLKREISESLQRYEAQFNGDALAAFQGSVQTIRSLGEFWGRLCAVPAVNIDLFALAAVWKGARAAILQALHAKQAAPLEVLAFDSATQETFSRYTQICREVAAIAQSLRQANAEVARVKTQTASDKVVSAAHELERLRVTQQRYAPAYAGICQEYLQAKQVKEEAEARKVEVRRNLDAHRDNTFPVYQERINYFLRRFNTGFLLTGVKPVQPGGHPSTSYQLAIGQASVPLDGERRGAAGPSFKNVLSGGDRKTLALACFFTALERDPLLAERIVVIDDPVSNLDDQRALATIQEIGLLASRAAQLIVLSHDRRFLSSLMTHATVSGTPVMLEIRRTGNESIIIKDEG